MNLRKEIRKILEEAFATDHYVERSYDRFIDKNVLEVGYEEEDSRGNYITVGTYKLPETIKQDIIKNIQLVENYNFPINKDYAIRIGEILIDKRLVNYYSEELKNESKSKNLIFLDKKTESNGNIIYAIVRYGEIRTIFFAKSYVSQDLQKMRVDAIIKNLDVLRNKKLYELEV